MKRFTLVGAALLVAAAVFASLGVASHGSAPSSAAAPLAKPKPKPKLPALPAQVRQRKQWIIGVKCDSPPFGYIDIRGEHAGFDVDIARAFSRFAFGRPDRVQFECAPSAAREPLLTTGRADLVISTSRTRRTVKRASTSRVPTTRQAAGCSCRTARRSAA